MKSKADKKKRKTIGNIGLPLTVLTLKTVK